MKKIDEFLPVSLRRDFLKMRAGIPIARGRHTKITLFVKSLLDSLTGEDREEEDE